MVCRNLRFKNFIPKKYIIKFVRCNLSADYMTNKIAPQSARGKVMYDYKFTIPNYINRTEKEIYVNLNMDLLLDFFSPYEVKDRKTMVTERYATQTNYVFTLEVPEGYEVDYVPENFFVDGGDLFHVKINYNQDIKGKITYSFDLLLDYIMLDVDRVPEMKELGKKLKNAYKETIILKKI